MRTPSRPLSTLLALFASAMVPVQAASDSSTRSGGLLRLADGSQAQTNALLEGTALVASKTSLLRRSESLDAGPVRISSRGTALVSTSGGNAKITCLEGRVDVRLASSRRQFAEIGAGQLLLVESGASVLPSPIEVDLQKIHNTSALLSSSLPSIPTSRAMERAIRKQQREIEKGLLVKSDVTLSGEGSDASVGGGSSGSSTNNNSSSSSSSGGSGGGGSSGGGSAGGGGAGAAAGGALGGGPSGGPT